MNLEERIKKLEEELAQVKQELEKAKKDEINSVEDAFFKLKPLWFLDGTGDISNIDDADNFGQNKCNMTSEKRAKQVKAFIQLHLIAEAMNLGVDSVESFYINYQLEIRSNYLNSSKFYVNPIFNSKELAINALSKFKPLFKDLYMLD